MHNQKKDNNNLKTKKQPQLTENQTVWKSDNQGVKEETFIQAGRRGGERQPVREDLQQGGGWRTGASKTTAARPGDKLHNPGLQLREIKSQTSDRIHLWELRQQWEKLPASQESSLERPIES